MPVQWDASIAHTVGIMVDFKFKSRTRIVELLVLL
jgi:hypothetical protein